MSAAPLLLLLAAQWPQDARALASWHAEHAAADAVSAPRADELRARLYVYQGAGAEAEAWAAAQALERLVPADADGRRYAVQLAAWDPARWRSGLELATEWLARHGDRPEAERSSVERSRELLAARVEARDRARSLQASRGWVPFAAVLIFAAGAVLALRRAA